ncbi:ATP-dependent DNA ligase [Tessaracoccus antarcticus]|uniref:DNA ligase n=1 Tax=Tessaracoccus antarcticus TaxID=2479848 RepID=A0A3M0G1K0_9ACTN|nr:ATP-dependent DNA ligase [Tessaracoccus antarcticus]RMB58851.1 ATP-dependent DNA ligase [Tessaracoccus antarcticus]
MLLKDIVDASTTMQATRSRLAKKAALVAVLRSVTADEAGIATSYLAGELRQRRTGLGWRSMATPPPASEDASLTLTEVDGAFEAMAALSGAGSQGRRGVALDALMRRATAGEQAHIAGLVTGELRQGALDALVVDALAEAVGAPTVAVRRAVMLSGSTARVAEAVLRDGPAGLAAFTLSVGTPVRPMLASSAPSVAEALEALGGVAVLDAKLDGIRVQVHKRGADVRVFTRTLEDITRRVPDLVEVVAALPAETAVLDGEALLMGADGRPAAFQDSSSRIAGGSAGAPLSVFFFDVLHLDGEDLIDEPAHLRFEVLARLLPAGLVVERCLAHDADGAEAFFGRVLAAGHEGVVAKDPEAAYEAGRRGASWIKVKPVHTLDLVVLAIEWGSGRRAGRLSNIHLGARDGAGGFVMLGKTFKGMTDAMLEWQTARFLALQTSREAHVVHVRPEQVVEVAVDGVQRSSRYPGGVALRFARVLRYRGDKSADEADTLADVLELAARH